jgi:integrase
MAKTLPTGHVRVIARKDGDVFYAKLKIPRPDGTVYEPQRRLGRVWSKRTRPPAGYLTRSMADARLEAILAGDDPLVNVEPPRAVVTFGEACDEHLRYLAYDKQRKRTYIRDARSTVNAHLVPEFGRDRPVEEIATEAIEDYRDRLLAAGLSHRTAQKILILLGGILGRAKRKRWIAANPMDGVDKVTVRRSDEFNVLSIDQVHAVAQAAGDALMGALILVAAFTGLRQGELLALRWRHLDFANRILHVRRNLPGGVDEEDTPKSHRIRSVPLSDQAIVALDGLSRREHFAGPDDLVFASGVGGHLLADDVRDAFYAALDAAGLAHLRYEEPPSDDNPDGVKREDAIVFHDLRHTFGTMCAAKGIDVVKIQKWMGHADIQTTMRYLHYVPQHDDAARLTAAFASESVPPDVPRTAVTVAQPSATRRARATL